MNKMDWLKKINPVLFLVFLVQAATGVIYFLVGSEILGVTHLFGGLLMILIAGIHLVLNWTWVRSNYFKKKALTDKG
ncbi:MAG: hypothetical protein A2509_02135 [Candidatus Edwardsbacteria bacterium RIFOXYD12_FULL_50_11]|uniref:Flavinylation-associated cytochrome domain-containing protein n=1 Tax=Candidatus Edwardsbacteria bacterium GWF2_54_11 TaxID=1817851 RepID=A0A1F5RBL5_9BACT|nr:MAG: hypothetical protein A2502_06000 [Candidatus Edwardsbacteria bacterium RifOxyC12_full_54_24]OGF07138.1 MAG: hypothetical protein A2273_09430 [Candidatus Edwardsbacteria bacterium RifOxyA12_full_54_48]OGF10896.1 MAG: hypothetical protein A3K15_07080 [Candidatus Edwardsbacteria bacterium GWE2_54_12]OGF11807.1 MAG: hypothetical protein A2024_12375 [Candidatus Edwardsbacteria bacterium GWF2_54_11]OGF15842.1 MAG: hypothetical protein A2509_02135 [Candidatus Edwardsbacteria bacterium RIFOXYD1